MAETTGVQESQNAERGESRNARGSFFKRNKALVLGGGGVAAFLLLSHKGSTKTGTSSQAQSEQDALAAQTAALESGAVIPPAAYGPDVTGQTPQSGGGDAGAGPSDGTNSSLDPNVAALVAAEAAAMSNGGADQDTGSATAKATATAEPATTTKDKGAKGKGTKTGKKRATTRKKTTTHANPAATHSGGHGATVHGRTFPGAKGATVHPGKREGVNVTNRVTVNYGGHTDTHVSVNNGQSWRDHHGGPPSRAVVHSAPHPAPHPAAHRAPARRH